MSEMTVREHLKAIRDFSDRSDLIVLQMIHEHARDALVRMNEAKPGMDAMGDDIEGTRLIEDPGAS